MSAISLRQSGLNKKVFWIQEDNVHQMQSNEGTTPGSQHIVTENVRYGIQCKKNGYLNNCLFSWVYNYSANNYGDLISFSICPDIREDKMTELSRFASKLYLQVEVISYSTNPSVVILLMVTIDCILQPLIRNS